MKGEDQALVNYWFRHVWETAWPLYPGIILTVALADIPISTLISKTWPGTVAMFFFGWLFLLRKAVPANGLLSLPGQGGAGGKDPLCMVGVCCDRTAL